jgi:hypothetical protein
VSTAECRIDLSPAITHVCEANPETGLVGPSVIRQGFRKMSLERVENEIRRLLANKEAEVISISGPWGVGKTFAWRKFLQEAKDRENGIALGRYSYVSLFGISTLDDLKNALFANTVSSRDIGIEPGLDTLVSNTTAVAKKLSRHGVPVLEAILDKFGLKTAPGTTSFVEYFWIKESVICIDDIERRGEKLAIRDVLGLISQLKEHKRCKVILILNDDAMEKDRKAEEFREHFEKVIDIHLKFAPTARESVAIALNSPAEHIRLMGEHCVSLGIGNIRIINRLQRAVTGLEPMLKEFDGAIMRRAIHSLVLLGWAHFDRISAPPFDVIWRRASRFISGQGKDVIGERDAAWNALLDAYGFNGVDEFDLALLEGIRDGYFDEISVKACARKLGQQINERATYDVFDKAWKLFHGSFDNNADEIAEGMVAGFIKNAHRINLGDVHGTVQLLKSLGKRQEAMKVIDAYVRQNANNKVAFDRSTQMFGDQLTDPDFIDALDNKFKTFAEEQTVLTVLLSMKDGWSADNIAFLRKAEVEAYYHAFKSLSGDTLRKVISNCLQFERIGNVGEAEKEVAARARKALERIGAESPLNALRVQKYGIVVNPDQRLLG